MAGYTQYGGLRPFGVSLLYMGYDKNFGFQLYQSDPSGNYGGWYATCIGQNNQAAQSILKQDYKEDCSLDEALLLAVKVFAKTLDSTTLTSEKRKSPAPHPYVHAPRPAPASTRRRLVHPRAALLGVEGGARASQQVGGRCRKRTRARPGSGPSMSEWHRSPRR